MTLTGRKINGEDRGDWRNEFDWERYLREQEEAIGRYLKHYDAAKHQPDRILRGREDELGRGGLSDEGDARAPPTSGTTPPTKIYTLHKNRSISTKAIHLSLFAPGRSGGRSVPGTAALAVALLASLHRGERRVQAIHALDFWRLRDGGEPLQTRPRPTVPRTGQ